jgi:hypothetical protein
MGGIFCRSARDNQICFAEHLNVDPSPQALMAFVAIIEMFAADYLLDGSQALIVNTIS